MTTFTTEDHIIAEQNGSITINVEPIPFAGMITITEPNRKELTDDEIIECAHEAFKKYKNWYHYQIDFARSILKKAQEK